MVHPVGWVEMVRAGKCKGEGEAQVNWLEEVREARQQVRWKVQREKPVRDGTEHGNWAPKVAEMGKHTH